MGLLLGTFAIVVALVIVHAIVIGNPDGLDHITIDPNNSWDLCDSLFYESPPANHHCHC
jgi:hypothetical protein